MQVSYAQNFEDVRLNRVFHGTIGFYIDVGANHPVFHSVTKSFYDRGWTGINIEPHPRLHGLLQVERPRDTNLNVGVSDAEGTLTFYEGPGFLHGWSTFHPGAADSYRRQGVEVTESSVPVTTLARICEQHAPATVDFLKIDAECYELQVIRGADWTRWRPRFVLIEAGIPELVAQWESLMDEADYLLAGFDGINRYYVRQEDRDWLPKLSPPVSALDHAISYDCLRFVDELERVTQQLRKIGGTDPETIDRLRVLARRYPRLATMTKGLLRRVS